MDFEQQFLRTQDHIKSIKMMQIMRRAMAIQARAKIKPNTMRPSLREMSMLRGGAPLSLYHPTQ